MKKKRFATLMLAASLVASSIASFASTGKGSSIYSDVKKNAFYDRATYYLNYEGIMTGYTGKRQGEFGSLDGITRGQVITTLWRLAGQPESNQEIAYPDVTKPKAYYYKAVKWGTEKGIIKGYDDGSFKPDKLCQRREIAKMITVFAETFGYPDVGSNDVVSMDMSQYSDLDKAGWAYDEGYVQWMAYHQIMTGTSDTTLSPRDMTTRKQFAIILTRLLTEIELPEKQLIDKNAPTAIDCSMHQDFLLQGIIGTQTTVDEYDEYGYTYQSMDEEIVTVDENGMLTGVGNPGEQAAVKVTSNLSGESKMILVQVGYGPATKLDYIKGDKEDRTIYLESVTRWSSTADFIKDIENVFGTYPKYRDLVFTFTAKDSDSNYTYQCRYDSIKGKVVIMHGTEDVTDTFNVDEPRSFDHITLTFPENYNIAMMLTDLANIADMSGKVFTGEFTYRNTTVTEISIADDFYVHATINGQEYFFFNINDNVYAQGAGHAADVREYIAIKQWTDENVISAELVQDPQ